MLPEAGGRFHAAQPLRCFVRIFGFRPWVSHFADSMCWAMKRRIETLNMHAKRRALRSDGARCKSRLADLGSWSMLHVASCMPKALAPSLILELQATQGRSYPYTMAPK